MNKRDRNRRLMEDCRFELRWTTRMLADAATGEVAALRPGIPVFDRDTVRAASIRSFLVQTMDEEDRNA